MKCIFCEVIDSLKLNLNAHLPKLRNNLSMQLRSKRIKNFIDTCMCEKEEQKSEATQPICLIYILLANCFSVESLLCDAVDDVPPVTTLTIVSM